MDALHLAQLNIARLRAPINDPLIEPFVAQLDTINALADRSEGFIWRLKTESGDATQIQTFDDPRLIVNMSVWRDIESLMQYVYQSDHLALIKQRGDWFTSMTTPFLVLWWIPAGTEPDVEEAKLRLRMLTENGPGPDAFTFARPFVAPFSTTLHGTTDSGDVYSAATVDDRQSVMDLLQGNGLPVADLDVDSWTKLHHWFLILRSSSGELIGTAALEPTRDGALIRSLCVDSGFRSQGHARALVHRVEALARARGIDDLYLLTDTAGAFFATMKYMDFERSLVPKAIGSTAQFADLCPDSSRCMRRTL